MIVIPSCPGSVAHTAMPARAGNASVDALHIHPPSEEIHGVRKDIKVVGAGLSRSLAGMGGGVKLIRRSNPPRGTDRGGLLFSSASRQDRAATPHQSVANAF